MENLIPDQKENCYEEFITMKLAFLNITHKKIVHNIFQKYTKQEIEYIEDSIEDLIEEYQNDESNTEDELEISSESAQIPQLRYNLYFPQVLLDLITSLNSYPYRQSLYIQSENNRNDYYKILAKQMKKLKNPYNLGIQFSCLYHKFESLIKASKIFPSFSLDISRYGSKYQGFINDYSYYTNKPICMKGIFENHKKTIKYSLNMNYYGFPIELRSVIHEILHMERLKILQLQFCLDDLNDDSLVYLGNSLYKLSHLQQLDLNLKDNKITLQGLEAFLKKLSTDSYISLMKLKINLEYNGIEDKSALDKILNQYKSGRFNIDVQI